jgi:hypothetical protein
MTSPYTTTSGRSSTSVFGKKIAFFLFSILVLASLAFPQASLAKGKGKKREPFKPPYVAISAIDTTAHTITIEHVNSKITTSKTYKITDQTDIEVNGQKGTMNDLQVGMKVDITEGVDQGTADAVRASPAPKA